MSMIRTTALLLVLLSASVSAAAAFDLSSRSSTYLQYREGTGGEKYLPLYEYLDMNAGGNEQQLSFHFGGWYRYDLKDETFDTRSTGDLQYAYLGYRAKEGNGFVNLGRIVVNQAANAGPVDGIAAGTDLAGGLNVSAFGGVPVETDIDTRTGDSVYGGRLSQGMAGVYRIGISYLQEKNDSEDFRKETGIDLWIRPTGGAELVGTSLYNSLSKDWANHNYYLTLGPFQTVTFRTEFSEVNYKDYFASATLSAFLLQPGGPIDPLEKMTMIGEEIAVAAGNISLSADYRGYSYDIAGNAKYYGGKLTYTGSPAGGSGLAVHRMDGETDRLKYSEYRVYGYRRIGKSSVTADLLAQKYDVEINGMNTAYSASLAGTYALSQRTLVGADLEYAKNPFYDKDVRGMIKLVYNFDYQYATKSAKGRK